VKDIIQHLKGIEHIFTKSIQLREKQLYLCKTYIESFKGSHISAYELINTFNKELKTSITKCLYEPFKVLLG